MIVGDVNIHLDDVNSTQVSRLVALLDDFGLHDVVGQPTHTRGHQLDIFVTRIDQPVPASIIVDPPLISDHSLIRVIFDAASVQVSTENAPVTRRQRRSFDQDGFISELQQSPLVLDL